MDYTFFYLFAVHECAKFSFHIIDNELSILKLHLSMVAGNSRVVDDQIVIGMSADLDDLFIDREKVLFDNKEDVIRNFSRCIVIIFFHFNVSYQIFPVEDWGLIDYVII